jgi:hypothetical protein
MKQFNKYILPVLCVVAFTSCEKEIIIDVPKYDEKLVLNSTAVTGDSIYVKIGKSLGILDYKHGQDLSIKNATVLLQANGVTVDTMRYTDFNASYTSKFVSEPGKKYTIKAVANGYGEAEASTDVPAVVPIDSIAVLRNVRVDIDGNPQDEVKIYFQDPATTGDYYIMSLLSIGMFDTSHNDKQSTCVNTTDAGVESIYNENIDQSTCLPSDAIYFRDALFNGQKKEMRIFVPSGFTTYMLSGTDTLYSQVVLSHVTESYFRFSKSYKFATENSGNPFAEPSNVYTNVKNGYGVFSL